MLLLFDIIHVYTWVLKFSAEMFRRNLSLCAVRRPEGQCQPRYRSPHPAVTFVPGSLETIYLLVSLDNTREQPGIRGYAHLGPALPWGAHFHFLSHVLLSEPGAPATGRARRQLARPLMTLRRGRKLPLRRRAAPAASLLAGPGNGAALPGASRRFPALPGCPERPRGAAAGALFWPCSLSPSCQVKRQSRRYGVRAASAAPGPAVRRDASTLVFSSLKIFQLALVES